MQTHRRFLLLCTLILAVASASEASVRDTSYTTQSGERVLRIETVVPAPAEEVWAAWTTARGLSGWIAPVVAVDFRVGGSIRTNYDAKSQIGGPGTISLPIINYIDFQLITLKVNLNDTFPSLVREHDRNLQEIVQIIDLGAEGTRIVSSMIGWGTGKEWDDAYKFFERGNVWTYQQLDKYCSGKNKDRQ